MSIVEHQFLSFKNVLSYTSVVDETAVNDFAKSVEDNLCVLGLQQSGKILLTHKSPFTEFIIPVDKSFKSNEHFEFKSEFKLVNAVRARHYGNFENIYKAVRELMDYINKNSLTPVTSPYYSIQDTQSNIFDIYIGISENVL